MKVGVLGGGQLGRMLALSGIPLGFTFRFLDPKPDAPARVAGELVRGAYDDPQALEAFVEGLDVVTWEFENVPVEAARWLGERVPVRASSVALERAQDRWVEKETFRTLGIPTTPYRRVDRRADLVKAGAELGFPAVLKARRMGYDGRGQRILTGPRDVDEAWSASGDGSLLLEAFVSYRRELSIVGARSRSGELLFYPLVENEHREGILVRTLAPATEVPPALQGLAESYLRRLLLEMDYVGVLALELFQVGDELLANEMAPRVHNSGHWTQDGAFTSQFENHMRAVAGFSLGSVEPTGWTVMVNILGTLPSPAAVLRLPGARLHLYGKAPRPGRKLGHVNVRGPSQKEAEARAEAVEGVLAAGVV